MKNLYSGQVIYLQNILHVRHTLSISEYLLKLLNSIF